MLDLSHIPNSQQDVKVFYSNGVTNAWQTWNKPRKCNYVWIMCIGGGGGGGGGHTYTGTYLAGGSGGGSGAVTRVLYNAQQLPDTLYVQVGLGGAPGTGSAGGYVYGQNGFAGTRSWVALQPTVLAQNIVAGSGATAAAGGPASTGQGLSAAGEVAIGQATATFITLANFISTTGQASPVYTVGNVQPLTSQITCAGATGGPFSGGGASVLSTAFSPILPGGSFETASGSNATNGANGITSWKPFFSTGGAGGGNALSGSGGNGGNGGIGCGGGGGGCGAFSSVAGNGGKGGDGLVVIISF